MVRNGSSLFDTPFGRFEKSYVSEPNTGCWLWTKSVNVGGYGQIRVNKNTILANRFSYSLFKGNPKDQCVLHTCDVRSCVNPDHLFLGDRDDNAKDRNRKGRVQRGQKHFLAKLTDLQVLVIREALKAGFSCAGIGRYFGVGGNTISNIKTKDTWKHI